MNRAPPLPPLKERGNPTVDGGRVSPQPTPKSVPSWIRFAFYLALAPIPGCLYGTLAWSPDGKWIAFVTQEGGTELILPAGWWAKSDRGFASNSSAVGPIMHTLWVCQAETRKCWRLAQCEDGLSSPSWSPDGLQLAYVRLGAGSDGRTRCDVLLQHGFDEPKVIATCTMNSKPAEARGLAMRAERLSLTTASMAPAWSPRGTFLAVPWADPPGTAIIRLADGTLVATYPNGYFPSWSPDELRLALVLPGDSEGYHVTSPNFGPLIPSVPTKHAVQSAIWEPSGQAFHVIAWHEQPNIGTMPPYTAELIRYDVTKQKKEVVRQVIRRQPPAGQEPASLFYARIPASPTLFAITTGSVPATTDVLEMSFDRQIPARHHVLLDPDFMAGAPSFGIDKQTVAMRLGAPQTLGVPALYNLRSGELRAIIPDHSTQVLAVQTIIERILHVYDVSTPKDAKNPTARWIRLPSPATATAYALRDGRVADRIELLTRFGLDLLALQVEGNPSTAQRRDLTEAAMFLNYTLGEYAATLRATEPLEPLLETSHDRLALSIVRAQCYLGMHKWSDARELLAILTQKAGKSTKEEQPGANADQMLLRTTIQELLDELASGEK